MVKTLQEAEGHLAELVEEAHLGMPVLISVDGKVRARLVPVREPKLDMEDRLKWIEELRASRARFSFTGSPTIDEIIDESRADRF